MGCFHGRVDCFIEGEIIKHKSEVIGTIEKINKLRGCKVYDVHRHYESKEEHIHLVCHAGTRLGANRTFLDLFKI